MNFSNVILFFKRKPLLSKSIIIIIGFMVFSLLEFLQSYNWLIQVDKQITTSQITTHFMGYIVVITLIPLVFVFYDYVFHRNRKVLTVITTCIGGAIVFVSLHSIIFSIFLLISDPLWLEYSFLLLLQDVLLNFATLSILSFGIALLFSELFYRKFGIKNKEAHEPKTIIVKDQGKHHYLKMLEIQYVVSADNYIEIVTENKKVLARQSLKKFEESLLDSQFLRIHRSVIINKSFVSHIKRTDTGEINIIMKDQKSLPLSRRRKEAKEFLLMN